MTGYDGGMAHQTAIVFYHYGDNPLTSFFQDIGTNLGYLRSYDRVVLCSSRKESWAAVQLPGSTEAFLHALESEGRTSRLGEAIDVFVFAHGRNRAICGPNETWIGPGDLEALPKMNTLRAVWSGACFGSSMHKGWSSLGAKAMAGTRGVNFFPRLWREHATDYVSDRTLRTAVRSKPSGDMISETLAYLSLCMLKSGYGLIDSLRIGTSLPAVESYFQNEWPTVPWLGSGRASILSSSEYVFEGDPTVRR